MTVSIEDFSFDSSKIEVLENSPIGGGLKVLVLKLAKEAVLPYDGGPDITATRRQSSAEIDINSRKVTMGFPNSGIIDLGNYGIAPDGVFYTRAMWKSTDTINGATFEHFTGRCLYNPNADPVLSQLRQMPFRFKGTNTGNGAGDLLLEPIIGNVSILNAGNIAEGVPKNGPPESRQTLNHVITVGLAVSTLSGGNSRQAVSLGVINLNGGDPIEPGHTGDITITADLGGSNVANVQNMVNNNDYIFAFDGAVNGLAVVGGKVTVTGADTLTVAGGTLGALDESAAIGVIPGGWYDTCDGIILTIIGRQG